MIHVGIDLHSRNMTLVAINDNGKLLVEEKLTTTLLTSANSSGALPIPCRPW
ncbi:hypothetical protein [Gracilimonas tropica]|uniref:hypothetical protein n=1 Tax=Gracilimonas tropica TaxID=454600 RepID=UPI0003A72138|nr:hypothetical protein [Gracilimonas tropica]